MGPAVPEPMIWLATFAVLSTFTVTAVLPGVLPRVLETASIWTTERAAHAAGLLGAAPEACNFGVQPYYFEVTEDTTPFNVTPKTWDIHAFNPRCQPQPLLDDLLDANVSAGRQLSIIAFGDRCQSRRLVLPQYGGAMPMSRALNTRALDTGTLISSWLMLAAGRASSLRIRCSG